MLTNIFRRLSEKRFMSLRYVDKNILSVVKNTREEWIYRRNFINISCEPVTRNNSIDFSKTTLRPITNLAIEDEKTIPKFNFEFVKNMEFTDDEIEKLLNLNWTDLSSGEFISNFEKLSIYAKQTQTRPNIDFENFFQAISNLSSNFSLEEIGSIINCIFLWDRTIKELKDTREKVLAILDKELLKRLSGLDVDNILHFSLLFNRLNYAKVTRFVAKALFKVTKKLKTLSPSQINRFMVLLGNCKNLPLNFYNIEHSLEDKWDLFSKEELFQILSGFTRNSYIIRNQNSRNHILDLILKHSENLNSGNITALVKYLSFNYKIRDEVDDVLYKILRHIQPRLEEFCPKALAYVCLLVSITKIHDTKLMHSIYERIERIELRNISIPDIDKIAHSMAELNYDSTNPLYKKIIEELNNSDRQKEVDEHNKAFTRIIWSLVIANIYEVNLIEKIMDPEYLKKHYKTIAQRMDQSIYCLDRSIVAELPNYTGSLLNDRARKHISKAYKSYSQYYDKNNVSNIIKEIITTCSRIFNSNFAAYADKILPHYVDHDVIVCLDKDNNIISSEPFLSKMELGNVKHIPEEAKSYKWLVFVISTRNTVIKNSEDFTGIFNMKCRQLRSLGYIPIPVSFRTWFAFKEHEDFEKRQEDYLRDLLNVR